MLPCTELVSVSANAFYRRETQDFRRLTNFPKSTQLVSDRAKIWTQTYLIPTPLPFPSAREWIDGVNRKKHFKPVQSSIPLYVG